MDSLKNADEADNTKPKTEEPETIKEEPETIKEESETIKEEPETIKEEPEVAKERQVVDDYISPHAHNRHKFDPSRVSSRSRTQ